MKEFKSQKIKSVIKDLLKKKNLTYEELAESLECSIPTVKRILGPEELTLNRLLQLCEIVEIDLAELETLTHDTEVPEEKFTEAQETFLAKNPNFFAYIMKLLYGSSPSEIAQTHNLTQRSTDKYLIGLERAELIKVTGRQKVKPVFKRGPTLGNGPLAKIHFASFINSAASFFKEIVTEGVSTPKGQKTTSPGRFVVQTMKITKASYDAWIEEQEKALRTLEKIALFEGKTKDPSELQTAVVVQGNAIMAYDHKALKILEGAAGEIPNI
jgi:transcriptional regulator with XRE-family HTH domain